MDKDAKPTLRTPQRSAMRVWPASAGLHWSVVVFGLASAGLGVIGLLRGDFTPVWHPVPDALQGQAWLAYACAALFLLAGLGIQHARSAPAAASILFALYALFAISWLRRVMAFPLMIGTWLGFCEQLALALGAVIAALNTLRRPAWAVTACRIAFGLCELIFGASHFLSLPETVAMTPQWLPLGQTFWAMATGAAHCFAGLALIAGFKPELAARCLIAMFLLFGGFVWAPQVFADPAAAFPWAASAINLALVGAVWALADLLGAENSRTDVDSGVAQSSSR